jgi:hypothetical protein
VTHSFELTDFQPEKVDLWEEAYQAHRDLFR